MREQWQIDQGKKCGCKGTDELCPCQNISPDQKIDITTRIKCAALAFANDYGPLSAANQGDDAAQEQLAFNLLRKLRQHGLTIRVR